MNKPFWGNSPETPNIWVLSTFHPNVWKQLPPPQCLTRSGGCTPMLLSRRADSDVDATAAADRTRKPRRCHVSTGQNKKKAPLAAKSKEITTGREDSRGERRREGAVARGSGSERERRREGAAARGSGDKVSGIRLTCRLRPSIEAYVKPSVTIELYSHNHYSRDSKIGACSDL